MSGTFWAGAALGWLTGVALCTIAAGVYEGTWRAMWEYYRAIFVRDDE